MNDIHSNVQYTASVLSFLTWVFLATSLYEFLYELHSIAFIHPDKYILMYSFAAHTPEELGQMHIATVQWALSCPKSRSYSPWQMVGLSP